jgi:hypothetical protein
MSPPKAKVRGSNPLGRAKKPLLHRHFFDFNPVTTFGHQCWSPL